MTRRTSRRCPLPRTRVGQIARNGTAKRRCLWGHVVNLSLRAKRKNSHSISRTRRIDYVWGGYLKLNVKAELPTHQGKEREKATSRNGAVWKKPMCLLQMMSPSMRRADGAWRPAWVACQALHPTRSGRSSRARVCHLGGRHRTLQPMTRWRTMKKATTAAEAAVVTAIAIAMPGCHRPTTRPIRNSAPILRQPWMPLPIVVSVKGMLW